LAWKSLAAEAGFWFGKIWSLRLGLEKPKVGKPHLNGKVLEKMEQLEGPPNRKGGKFGHGTTSQARKERRKEVQWGEGRPT